MREGQEDGISFVDGAKGTLRDNDIFGNGFAGVAVGDGSAPSVTANRIHHGVSKRRGQQFAWRRTAPLRERRVRPHELTLPPPHPRTPSPSRTCVGRQSGIYCYSRGGGVFQDNEVYSNALSNVEVASYATPTLVANSITEGEQAGVFFHDGGDGALRLNRIYRNRESGVTLRDAASAPHIERNSIEENGNVGVRVFGASGALHRNRIVGNARSGVVIEPHSRCVPSIADARV